MIVQSFNVKSTGVYTCKHIFSLVVTDVQIFFCVSWHVNCHQLATIHLWTDYLNDTRWLAKLFSLVKLFSSFNAGNFVNNNKIIIISATIFIVLSSQQSHCENWLRSRDEYRMAPGGRWPLDQANRLEPEARLNRQPVNHIHRRHLLLLLSPKADTHFTIPQRMEGWVNLDFLNSLPACIQSPIQVVTGPSVD